MIRKIAWNTFKNTGDINTFLELKQIENIEENINGIKKIQNLNEEENLDIVSDNQKQNNNRNIL